MSKFTFHKLLPSWPRTLVLSIVLLIGSSPAIADEIACKGEDMLQALQVNNPDSYQTMLVEEAASANGQARLWKIEKAGAKTSYLFGTMHLTDPRVIDLTPEARSMFDTSRTVVIESTEILDPAVAMKALMAKPDLMMFTNGESLASYLKPEQARILEERLKVRGIQLATVSNMKPWLIAGMVSLPACEAKRKKDGAPFLDIKIAKDAQSNGKELVGLETMAEQFEAMASVPMELHMKGLLDSLSMGDKLEDVLETMVVLYTEGRIGAIVPFLKAASGEKDTDNGYSQLEKAMIVARNRTMLDRALPVLAKGPAFIAVGALHLPGDSGLVELFRQQGFAVTAIER